MSAETSSVTVPVVSQTRAATGQIEVPAAVLAGPVNEGLLRISRDGVLFAGSAAGLLDPFYLSGVEAALVSGVVAARAVDDPGGAARAFERLTRGFALKRRMARRAWSPSAWPAETLAAALLHHALGRVGRAS